MGRGRKNFISLLDESDFRAFSSFERDFMPFRGKVLSEDLFRLDEIKKNIFMDQIHSNIVRFVDEAYENEADLRKCDGIITCQRGVALCVLSADCLPLLLYHKAGYVGALHSGRKGSFENILASAVNLIAKDYESKTGQILKNEDFSLVIGAGICAKNYEIGGEILDYAKKHFNEFLQANKLDLKALVKNQAKNLGIKDIKDIELCSFDEKNLPSYRRDKTAERFASVIYLRDENAR